MATVISYGSITVRLPSPDFDNSEKLDFDRINRKTRGGDLIIFRDEEWTHTQTLSYRFSFMTQSKVNRLLAFLKLTVGLTITLTDFEGFAWSGIITTPTGEVSQPERQGFSAQFDFQGVIVP